MTTRPQIRKVLTMGSVTTSPRKKVPEKKAASTKPSKLKPKASKDKAGSKSSESDQPSIPTSASAAAGATSGQHLRIPTNLPVCVVDNGGWTVKYGLVPPPCIALSDTKGDDDDKKFTQGGGNDTLEKAGDNLRMSSMYNATARPPHQLTVLAGDEITARMKNLGQLSWNYPMERGMICDGETQLRVWARVLEVLGVVPMPMMMMMTGGRMVSGGGGFLSTISAARRAKPDHTDMPRATYSSNNSTFFLLEPPFVPSVISEGVDCMLFRELGMARVSRKLGACMAALKYLSFCRTIPDNKTTCSTEADENGSSWINDNTNCCCVVDSGFSFTHIVPTYRGGEALVNAIRRLNIGGKVLTNLLKESVTYRQWNMMDEFHIVNDAKEQLCFVSGEFDKEMARARAVRKGLRWFDREYLLPDFVNTFNGSIRLPEPLQRKREMDEMASLKKKIDRLDDRKLRQELADEARDLSRIQVEEDWTSMEEKTSQSHKSKSEKIKRTKNEKSTKIDGADGSGIDDDDSDSDEESQQQRLQRLKAMREEERTRREQESLERQALAMSVERFAIPEVLFRPSDIGLDCGGIAEAIVESINACDPTLRAAMYHNILLVGGNAKIPGFSERLRSELRKLCPSNYELRVYLPDEPASYAWEVSIVD
jgi:actin-related protein